MYREIKIGEKTIPMLANGATPLRYRMVFGRDIISEFQRAGEDGGIMASSISELAYIMASAADKSVDMNKLNINSYANWLEQFEPLDLTMAAEEVVDVYMGNAKTTSEVKKKARGAVSES